LSYWEIEDVLAAILVTMDSDTALKDYEFKAGDTAVIEIDGRRPYYFLCAPDGWEQLPQPEDFAPGFAPQPEPMNGLAKITGGLSEDGERR